MLWSSTWRIRVMTRENCQTSLNAASTPPRVRSPHRPKRGPPRNRHRRTMVDNFSIALTHVLMGIALWRLLYRDDLDHEVSPRKLWQQRRDAEAERKSTRLNYSH